MPIRCLSVGVWHLSTAQYMPVLIVSIIGKDKLGLEAKTAFSRLPSKYMSEFDIDSKTYLVDLKCIFLPYIFRAAYLHSLCAGFIPTLLSQLDGFSHSAGYPHRP